MAARGVKPKPAHLRIVDGTRNATRHGSEQKQERIAESGKVFGKPVKPEHLTGEAERAWNRYIAPAAWLDATREPAAVAFCELWQEFMSAPVDFAASKHGQMRAYMSELGLTDERNRVLDAGQNEDDDGFA